MDKRSYVLLLQKGLSQKTIAERMGVHQPKVSEWLNGVRMPNSVSLFKLANVLNEDPYDLTLKLKRASEL
jgi:transcriptional regulator with XRE-family HTH domain